MTVLWGNTMSKVKIDKKLIMLTRTALLAATALVLSILESFLPDLPFVLPGMKLGLGNIAVLLAAELCPLQAVLYIAVIRALFTLITRGATAFFMSLGGAVASSLVMYFFIHRKKPASGCLGIGIYGAFTHNSSQLCVASLIIGKAAWAYLPIVSLFALFSGSLTALAHFLILPNITKLSFFH